MSVDSLVNAITKLQLEINKAEKLEKGRERCGLILVE